MADKISTEADVEVETTDTEDAAEALENDDVSFDSFDEEAELDDKKSKDASDKAQSEDEETTEESESDEAETETEDKAESTDTDKAPDEESEQTDEDKKKVQAREAYEKRQQEKADNAKTQEEQKQSYLEEAEDDKDLALRQLQIDAYDNRVERNQTKLSTGYERAVKDFDILSSDNPFIKAEIDEAIDAFQAMYVTIDQYGNPSQLAPNANFYEYLQKKADSLAKLTGLGTKKQQDSKSKEKSRTLTAPSRAPKQGKVDADMEAFDEEANR